MKAAQIPPRRDPRGPAESAVLRDPLKRPPSRPRFESGERPQRHDSALEFADRLRVAKLIREPRLRMGMLQVEASRALGVPQTILSAWERAKQTVPAEMRVRIATLYGISPTLFDGLDTASVAVTEEEQVLLNRFRVASPGEREAALKAVMP